MLVEYAEAVHDYPFMAALGQRVLAYKLDPLLGEQSALWNDWALSNISLARHLENRSVLERGALEQYSLSRFDDFVQIKDGIVIPPLSNFWLDPPYQSRLHLT